MMMMIVIMSPSQGDDNDDNDDDNDITVTSVTDVIAFACGAVTNLPGLQSFCVALAIGIGSIYILQVSS